MIDESMTGDLQSSDAVEGMLLFWFGPLEGANDFPTDRKKLWWMADDATDADIRERFGALVERALAGELTQWCQTARGTLALVLLLDQCTRSLGRGDGAAFAGDERAQSLVAEAIDAGTDRELRFIERSFLYMPLMHAESKVMAQRSLDVFGALSKEIKETGCEGHPDFLSPARTHADIVLQFGRYPHRNAIVGRESTAEELEYLAQNDVSFGQSKR